jgi:hypothetical protein
MLFLSSINRADETNQSRVSSTPPMLGENGGGTASSSLLKNWEI